MDRYTVDAAALIRRALGVLPDLAADLFKQARAGRTALEAPIIAATEAIFFIDRRDEAHGTTLPLDAAGALAGFNTYPVTFIDDTEADMRELVTHTDLFPSQMHDAMIVSNHVNRGTDAIITSDGKMDKRFPTIWD